MNHRIPCLLLVSSLGWGPTALAEQPTFRKVSDLVFAEVDDRDLLLDLYLPRTSKPAPLIVYIHGGAWRAGSKDSMPLAGLLDEGYAIASVAYRLTPEARFPAQVHDIKAAIRFLRGKQEHYPYDARKIAVAGSSAGGHLAALVGVTNGIGDLEGSVGAHFDQSSDVQAIVAYFGASNLLSILQQSTPHGAGRSEFRHCNCCSVVSPSNSGSWPSWQARYFMSTGQTRLCLLLHGDQDPQMPINQSHELHGKYKSIGLPVSFHVLHGEAHGGKGFYDEARTKAVSSFLASCGI